MSIWSTICDRLQGWTPKINFCLSLLKEIRSKPLWRSCIPSENSGYRSNEYQYMKILGLDLLKLRSCETNSFNHTNICYQNFPEYTKWTTLIVLTKMKKQLNLHALNNIILIGHTTVLHDPKLAVTSFHGHCVYVYLCTNVLCLHARFDRAPIYMFIDITINLNYYS